MKAWLPAANSRNEPAVDYELSAFVPEILRARNLV